MKELLARGDFEVLLGWVDAKEPQLSPHVRGRNATAIWREATLKAVEPQRRIVHRIPHVQKQLAHEASLPKVPKTDATVVASAEQHSARQGREADRAYLTRMAIERVPNRQAM